MSGQRLVDAWVARAASPTDAAVEAAGLTHALEHLGRAVREAQVHDGVGPRTPRAVRRRRRVVAITATVGTLAATFTGAAAAGAFRAHTGIFGAPGNTENDTSEYLDTNAPDFPNVARRLAKGVDFAPGYTFEQFLPQLVPDPSQPGPTQGRHTMMQVTGVKGTIEGWAFCSWERTWLEARDQADDSRQQTAMTHLRAITALPVMAAINARTWDSGILDSAQRGDLAPMNRDIRTYCPAGPGSR